ncbi:Anucleate primary sterigmata A protein [Rutstroemia sp. NJR-2017a WRK4]|nr:Anucleate primary sterigmata A protein [Rutstroemia sp. NJR-2017a WRK4]
MSTSLAMDHPSLFSDTGDSNGSDPFLSPPSATNHHRFSHFDKQLFALGPSTSPEQAKRALEAHLAETERRIQEASNLGTTLLQQRKDLGDRLKEVEKQQSEGDITPELRQKLFDIEKEYNEVGRETARAFLPKSRASSSEMSGSPFVDKRSASPSKFESQATSSPSKFSVPNRKQRNQPSNRVHDIEFATEISTSLLAQVRHLQALLAEKEETLKTVALEKSRLEIEAEGLSQRLRTLDESESRYKDENWNLETQIHEHLAAQKEASDREKKLTQNLNILQSEKNAAQKELDEIKLSHAKLQEQHTSAVKHHDVELGTVKRTMLIAENERGILQKRLEELTGQNQELARAVAHQRGRLEERDESRAKSDEEFQTATDGNTPEHSPPPSPIKVTPRHSMLESETLKSSLHHAHRMIQNLKGNIHREKTEKLELKRMLQEARDELEVARRGEPAAETTPNRKGRKAAPREFKKPFKAGQLGGMRSSKSEFFPEDTNWEDAHEQASPTFGSRSMGAAAGAALAAAMAAGVSKSHKRFGSSTEQSDAFETANEHVTETDDFETVAEDLSDDENLTETEKGGTVRAKPSRASIALSKTGNRESFNSTASTSEDEYMLEDPKTPTTQPQRLRLKMSRGNRRSHVASEEPQVESPTSFVDSTRGTPLPAGQSLFAELGELGSDDESVDGTPSRYASRGGTPQSSRPSTAKAAPASIVPPVPKLPMTDSGMMTEPWEPEPLAPRTPLTAVPVFTSDAGTQAYTPGRTQGVVDSNDSQAVSPGSERDLQTPVAAIKSDSGETIPEDAELSRSQKNSHSLAVAAPIAIASAAVIAKEAASTSHPDGRPPMSDAASQWHDEQMKHQLNGLLKVQSENDASRPVSTTYSDMSSQYDSELTEAKLARFPSPPVTRANTPMTTLAAAEAVAAPSLTMSAIHSEHLEPIITENEISEAPIVAAPFTPQRQSKPIPLPLGFSSIQSVDTEPIEPASPRSPKRDAVILPRYDSDDQFEDVAAFKDQDELNGESEAEMKSRGEPVTPKPGFISSVFGGWNKKSTATSAPIIAEDETSQSPSESPAVLTPESQRPFREVSGNATERPLKKLQVETSDESSQTALTAEQIDDLFKSKRQETILAEDSQKSPVHSPRGAHVPAALRIRKSQESVGSIGRSSLKSPDTELPTPSSQAGISLRAGTTPRARHSSNERDMSSPTGTGPSRHSSVSSFASEVDTRFNLRAGIPVPQGVESGTDPRMINAITQTMIGEYLWKYTRKAGRGGMSENRHRRYFWVHPYTRTLYWSDRDPSTAGRSELKAKSVAIEAVRVVTDDNPMPPGLHRKSLVIMTPGRTVKFTASTGQRHETWFNALSYLLLRTGEDAVSDTVEVSGNLTHEDVDEFNPGFARPTSTRRGPPSLSSYNSRTTRNESPISKSRRYSTMHPHLTSRPSRPSLSTFSRLSSYLIPGEGNRTFSGRRSRSVNAAASSIYEASEVHDSAEDLREQIERQDRKHDVGHLHTHPPKGRQTMSAASGSYKQTHRAQSRASQNRLSEAPTP